MKCIYIRQYQTNFELPKKAQSPPGSIVTININYTVQKQTFILLKSSGGPMTCQMIFVVSAAFHSVRKNFFKSRYSLGKTA